MKLIDFISEDRVLIPLETDSLRAAAESLVNALVVSGVALSPEVLEGLLGDSLPSEVVTVGRQAFLLHFRTDAVEDTAVALGVAPEPIPLKESSTKEARIVILAVAPHRESSTYLQVVAAIAKALGEDETLDVLLSAKTPGDLLNHRVLTKVSLPGHLTVRDFMVFGAPSVKPDTTIQEAARIMVRKNIQALPVVSEQKEVLGMVSHRELVSVMAPRYVKQMNTGEGKGRGVKQDQEATDPRKLAVREIMDRSILCVSDEQNFADVATMMINKDVGQLPVVREGVLVGMLFRANLVKKMMGL